MEKEIHADYIYLFAESDAIRPSSSKSWSTLFNHPMGVDLGGGNSPSSETSTLSLPTQTIRQSNYDDALHVSHSASSSIIDSIARSANIQLEEVSVNDEKRHKYSPVILSPNLSGTKTKNNNGINEYFNKFSGKNDDQNDIKASQTLTNDKIKLKKNEFGVYSKDSKLNKDSKELYKFFMSHNDKPEMSITIHGYHTEEKDGTIRVVDENNGYDYEKDVDVVEVTDFDFTIDLSDHILPKGEIYTIPSKDDDDYDIKEGKDIKQVLEEYCKNNSRSKEIEMRKVIIWDFENLTK
ncbi:3390_t:CDS:2, partial [Funneliformis mosseae]